MPPLRADSGEVGCDERGRSAGARPDAGRNRELLVAAALQAFTERGADDTSLEEIARRAGVGIGTLYRHFPGRQALLEALYVDEVAELCRSAAEVGDADPWEALNRWLMGFTR